MTVLALAVGISFALSAPFATRAERLYARFHDRLCRFETSVRLPEERPVETGDAVVLILGMGRVGTGAYDEMRRRYEDQVIGADADPAVVAAHHEAGRRVILADATDSDFWRRIHTGRMRIAMLAMASFESNRIAATQLQASAFDGFCAALVKYDDEIAALRDAGVNVSRNLYEGAGDGFADFVCNTVGELSTGAQVEEGR